jgi:GTP cyclohydrolase IB
LHDEEDGRGSDGSAPVSRASVLIDHTQAPVWMEDLITAAEAAASSPVFPVLKRTDERQVTMHGYDHPVFVEDMARAVTERLRADSRIARFTVTAASDESIHNHGAFARLSWPPEE